MSKKLTNSSGIPYFEHQDSQTVGARGPVLLQDFILQENLAHFVRERIPERVVHAKGSGAYGKFTVTQDITQYTRAKLFSKIGNTCKMFLLKAPCSGASSFITNTLIGVSAGHLLRRMPKTARSVLLEITFSLVEGNAMATIVGS